MTRQNLPTRFGKSLAIFAGTFCLFCSSPMASGANFVWNTGSGQWSNAANWLPFGVPAFNDHVMIGMPTPGLQPGVVSGSGTFGSMELTNGMILDTAGGQIGSLGLAEVTGTGTTIIVRNSPLGINEHDFSAHLQMQSTDTLLELIANPSLRLFSTPSEPSYSAGTIRGRGFLDVIGTAAFYNNGSIRPTANGGITIRQSDGSGTLHNVDLDGFYETGSIRFLGNSSELTVEANALSDHFQGNIIMEPDSRLNMNLANTWMVHSDATITVNGGGDPLLASRITGAPIIFRGNLDVVGNQGSLRIEAPITFDPSANVVLGNTDRLNIDGPAFISGGTFTMNQGAQFEFNSPTTIQGGVFNTFSSSLSDGSIRFDGPTTWDGNVTINGAAMQNGLATVSGVTTINADRFDMDGLAQTSWNINSNLTVNVGALSIQQPNHYDGTINIGSGLISRITMNLDDPNASWTLEGTMNISGHPALYATRLAGSRMIVEGNLNVSSGFARVNNDMRFASTGTFAGPAQISVANGSVLRTHGELIVEQGVQFSGTGSLSTGATGHLVLDDGVFTSGVGLIHGGLLEVGSQTPGMAAVGHFTGLASGNWQVEVGGFLAGLHHDALQVNGLSELGGELSVEIVDLGVGFDPMVGDTFTVMNSLLGVTGQFTNNPISYFNGLEYQWTVLYNPNTVQLQITSISVPEPSVAALVMLAGCLSIGCQRFRRQA